MRQKLLVVSPHPDDETLGAGGTILKYKDLGWEAFWLNFTDKKEEYGYPQTEVAERTEEIKQVYGAYQFDGLYNLQLEPAGLDKYSRKELVGLTADVVNDVLPNIVIIPYIYDVHSDHRIVSEVVYSCTKTFRFTSVRKIIMMEITSESDFAISLRGFIPNYFIDITPYLGKKLEIVRYYKNELAEHPFPRSLENLKALAVYRGAIAGCGYAEGFILVKEVE